MSRGNSSDSARDALKPKRPIRRFDIFAEYNRLKGRDKGMDESHAKGYGLWVAKVVASGGGRRAFRGSERGEPAAVKRPGAQEGHARQEAPAVPGQEAHEGQEWHELGGEPQTDALFDREIIARMGPDFYTQVFAPTIAQAVDQGRSYESIRDTLRKEWTPVRS